MTSRPVGQSFHVHFLYKFKIMGTTANINWQPARKARTHHYAAGPIVWCNATGGPCYIFLFLFSLISIFYTISCVLWHPWHSYYVWQILFFFYFSFSGCPEAVNLLVQNHVEAGQLGKPLARVRIIGPARAWTCYPKHSFSPLLLSVQRLGSCQWNRVVAGATAAFDWSLMVPVKPPKHMKIHQI